MWRGNIGRGKDVGFGWNKYNVQYQNYYFILNTFLSQEDRRSLGRGGPKRGVELWS